MRHSRFLAYAMAAAACLAPLFALGHVPSADGNNCAGPGRLCRASNFKGTSIAVDAGTFAQLNVVALDAGSVSSTTFCFNPPTCSMTLVQSGGTLTNTGMSLAMPSLTSISWGSGASQAGIQNGSGVTTGFARSTLGGGLVAVPGTYFKATAIAANVSTGETTLQQATHLAQFGNDMDLAGRGWKITAWGSFAANANTKTIKLKFGPTQTDITNGAFSGGATTNGGHWFLECYVLRSNGTSNQVSNCRWVTSSATPLSSLFTGAATEATGTLDWSITLTGTGGASNDIINAWMRVEYAT